MRPEESSAPGPLTGVVVADLSTVLAGPYCTMLLGDLGADVIKVEPPDGDPTRGWGPPWVGSATDGLRTAAYFLAVNRNKRSIRLDLRSDPGRATIRRLVAAADVLVENFRPGGLERLGLGDAELERLNPRLIHLAISGYGRTGPEASTPGFDFVLQAETGLMSITGFPDDEGGRATKVGVAIADVVTGLHGAVAVLGALAARRGDGGAVRSQRIDVSILESTLSALVNQAQNAFVSGRSPARLGNAHPNIVPYETFETADGEIAVAVGSERQWQRFCSALQLEDLADDQRFATNGARVEHRSGLRALLAERFATAASAEWLERLRAAEVPSGPINDVLAAFEAPPARAVGARVELAHPALGRVDQVKPPFELSRTPASIRRPPPLLGEHSDEILAELDAVPHRPSGGATAGYRGQVAPDAPQLPMPDAVLFDLDGTLVDTVATRIDAWLEVFEEFGLPATREQVAPLIGVDGKRLAREVAAAASRPIDDARAEAIDKRCGEIFERRNSEPRPLPGVGAVVDAIEAHGIKWAIATSSRREQVATSVDALGLRREPTIIDGSHVEHAKPEPDLLLLAAREIGAEPARCWYVGDSTWDMVSAVAAGMIAIGVSAGSAVDDGALTGAGARRVVRTLDELAGAIDGGAA